MNLPVGSLCRVCLLWTLGGTAATAVELRVVGPGGAGVGGIAVYLLQSAGGRAPPGAGGRIEIRQRERAFRPYLGIAPAGATVVFVNDDDITHHVYSVAGSYRFSYTIRAGEATAPLTLGEPGLIAMGCNIHDWMSGYLKVVPTPWIALTDAAGRARFEVEAREGLRAFAWHPHYAVDAAITSTVAAAGETLLRLPRALPDTDPQRRLDEFEFLDDY